MANRSKHKWMNGKEYCLMFLQRAAVDGWGKKLLISHSEMQLLSSFTSTDMLWRCSRMLKLPKHAIHIMRSFHLVFELHKVISNRIYFFASGTV